jgi:hypothetical protein
MASTGSDSCRPCVWEVVSAPSVEIASVAVEGAVAMVVYSVVIELEGSEKPACVVETIVRYVE